MPAEMSTLAGHGPIRLLDGWGFRDRYVIAVRAPLPKAGFPNAEGNHPGSGTGHTRGASNRNRSAMAGFAARMVKDAFIVRGKECETNRKCKSNRRQARPKPTNEVRL